MAKTEIPVHLFGKDGATGRVQRFGPDDIAGWTAQWNGGTPQGAALYVNRQKFTEIRTTGPSDAMRKAGYEGALYFHFKLSDIAELEPVILSVHFAESGDIIPGGEPRLFEPRERTADDNETTGMQRRHALTTESDGSRSSAWLS